jgi:5-methyltetrahydropteroyltriglutamate--homocysteine methyltransferase
MTYIGANREIKKAVEAYWAGKTSADDLQKVAAGVRKASWTSVKGHRVDFVPRCVYSWSIRSAPRSKNVA